MTVLRLHPRLQSEFARAEEIFPGVQLGHAPNPDERAEAREEYCLVVDCQVAVYFDELLQSELDRFYGATWGGEPPHLDEEDTEAIVRRYLNWMDRLPPLREAEVVEAMTRQEMFDMFTAFSRNPPPPPNRPGLVRGPRHPRGGPPNVRGHLPFKTRTKAREVFYKYEAWPISQRLVSGSPCTIAPGTYASPSTETLFMPTGFSAVARNALPSFFPACFRHEIQPKTGSEIRCGAIVPMYGQAGGGVEVMFLGDTRRTPPGPAENRGPFANPVIIPPL